MSGRRSTSPTLRRRTWPIAAALALGACSDAPVVTVSTAEVTDTSPATTGSPVEEMPTSTTSAPPVVGPIEWTPIEAFVDEGWLTVPLDWDEPTGPTARLYLVRHRATDQDQRIGSLLVNPGGPGAPGSSLGRFADAIYGPDLVERFDIIGWDPRGTGRSEPSIDCGDEYDTWFGIDSSPDDQTERDALVEAAQDFVGACQDLSGDALPHVSSIASANDIDAIRRALGEQTISYFGFSYGSELGALWATLFPDTVRAAVLDGAVDPTVGYFEQNVQQAAGFEAALTELLDACSADRTCSFHNEGRAAEAYDRLSAQIDQEPLTGERIPITQGVLATAVAASLYDRAAWYRLEDALDAAQRGDGSELLTLYDEYFELDTRGRNTSNVIETYFAIGCLDDPGTTSPDELYGRAGELAAAAPRTGPSYQMELMVCALWPHRPDRIPTLTAAGAGPIVVVGTTGDTATPYASSVAMADFLEDGILLTVEADQHTGYGADRCADQAIEAYLVDPNRLPDEENSC